MFSRRSKIQLRNRLLEKYKHRGERIFDRLWVQVVGGFRKRGDMIFDRLPSGVRLEYFFHSAIGRQLFYYGEYEQREIAFFTELLRTRNTPVILDVGANIGVHSLTWSRALPRARIIAVEPAPATAAILRRNVVLNAARNIEMVEVAVSDHPGRALLHCCEDNAYSALKDTGRNPVAETVNVEVTTIDEFVRSRCLQRVDLLKIDVEGFEAEVIAGSREMIHLFRPELFVEIYGGNGSNRDPAGTVEDIRSLDYEAFVLTNGEARPYVQHRDDQYNYYFSPNRSMLNGKR